MPCGPRCQPTGHARPTAIGWQKPPGPRHQPGPHPSAAWAAPAKATTPSATRDALKIKLFMRSIPPYETLSEESARMKRQAGLTEHERLGQARWEHRKPMESVMMRANAISILMAA